MYLSFTDLIPLFTSISYTLKSSAILSFSESVYSHGILFTLAYFFPVEFENTRSVRFVAPVKAFAPIFLTVLYNVSFLSDVQFLNALSPIVLIVWTIFIVDNWVHPLNAWYPIEVSVSGNITFFTEFALSKTLFGTFVIPLANVTVVTFAPLPIISYVLVTVLGIVRLVSPVIL